jgi:cytochrome c
MLLLAVLLQIPGPALAADPAKGRDTFKVCAACHSNAPDAIGPSLKGIVGRTAGTLPGFRYSGPLKRSGVQWTPDKLRNFLKSPQSVIPGNRMPYSGTTPEVAADLVAYLATL